MTNDGIQEKVQKAHQAASDINVMISELNEERETIYENILTADIRPTVARLAEINGQLKSVQELRRGHANRLKAFMAGIREAVT